MMTTTRLFSRHGGAAPPRLRRLTHALLGAGLCGACVGAWAQALPQGATVVHGKASFQTQGQQLTVRNSASAILEWQRFSIAPDHKVHFQQPGATSQVLNRVVGTSPSAIQGQLTSNGRVWLLNPNGILFGPNARVDVAGLVAGTLNINDADWRARQHALFADAPGSRGPAGVRNQGTLRTTAGGHVMLLAADGGVRNEGVIETPGGGVMLAAARRIDLADSAMPHIAYRIEAPAGEAVNLGVLRAADGRIDLQAALVAQRGSAQADGTRGLVGGSVLLQASQAIDLPAGSTTRADGARGGSIVIDSGRTAEATTLVAGSVSAQGTHAEGGSIRLLGSQVGLLDGARIDASGRSGGGEVLVGGGLQGRDAGVPNAGAVFMGPGAAVHADATGSGNGGRIVLWSDRATRAYGGLSARGGAEGGDGGLVETSGGWLDARPTSIATQAPRGKAGMWLIDPNDIRISDVFTDDQGGELAGTGTTAGPIFETTGAPVRIRTQTIVDALAQNDVSINTRVAAGGADSGQAGTITISDANAFVLNGATPRRLVFKADADIVISNSTFTLGGTGQSILFNAPVDMRVNGTTVDATGSGHAMVLKAGRSITFNSSQFTFAGAGHGLGFDAGAAIGLDGSEFSLRGPDTILGMVARDRITISRERNVSMAADSVSFRVGPGVTSALTSFSMSGGASVSSGSTVVQANSVTLGGNASITGTVAGTAITIAGTDGNLREFTDSTIAGALSTPNGRWLIHAEDPYNASFRLGTALGNAQQFTQHRALFGDPNLVVAGAGNGVLTTLNPSVTLSGPAVNVSKVYDGTRATPAIDTSAFTATGLIQRDRLSAPAALQYASADVGSAIPLLASASAVIDTRGRPVFGYDFSGAQADWTGSIAPATLLYVAAPTAVRRGLPPPPLGGDVAGFVGGDSLDSATTGTLAFTTTASAASPPGRYAVRGAGLAARNYVLFDEPANLEALRVIDPTAPGFDVPPWFVPRSVLPPPVTRGWFSAMPTALPVSVPLDDLFGPLDWSALAPQQVLSVLSARDEYSQFNHHHAMRELESNPMLADIPFCQSVGGAVAGTCRLTSDLVEAFKSACLQGICAVPVSMMIREGPPPETTPTTTLAAPGAAPVPGTAPALIRPDPAAPPAAPGAPAPDGRPPAPGAAPATRPVEPSDAERSRPKRWLLSIGIGEYRDPLMHGVGANAGRRQRIFSSKRDADLMSTELKQSLGFESVAVGTASKAEIVGAFNVLKAFAQPQDSVVVYYAGYGQSDPSRKHCYWSTSTSRHDDPQQWISNRNTGDMLGAIRANQVILLVDSCFADAVREDDRVDIEAVAARGAGRTGQRAATVMVSGTNAPLADKNQGDNSAFANSIVTRTHDLKAPLRGVQVFVDVRSKIAELLSRITEDAYIVGYRGSARAGHRPGGDFVFRPKAQSPEDP